MEHVLVLNSPKCSSESVSKPRAWLCFTESPFFLNLGVSEYKQDIQHLTQQVTVSLCVSQGDENRRWNTGGSGQLQSCTIKFQSVQGESSLVSAASASPRNYKNLKHSKIDYHIEHHQLLQPNIPSFIYTKKSGLPPGRKFKFKALFLISFSSLSCLLQEKWEDSFI